MAKSAANVTFIQMIVPNEYLQLIHEIDQAHNKSKLFIYKALFCLTLILVFHCLEWNESPPRIKSTVFCS